MTVRCRQAIPLRPGSCSSWHSLQVMMKCSRRWKNSCIFWPGSMAGYPSGHSYALLTIMDVLYPTKELICTLSSAVAGKSARKLLAQLGYLEETVPGLAVLVKTEENGQELCELAPYTRDYPVPETGAQFYLCVGSECRQPTAEFGEVLRWLGETAGR